MTKQSSIPRRALAHVGADLIHACGAIEARLLGAVINVGVARRTRPAVDAVAGEAAVSIGASGAVFAHVGRHGTLVDVARAEAPSEGWRAEAGVGVGAVQAGGAVLATVALAVVDVHFAVVAREPCQHKNKH